MLAFLFLLVAFVLFVLAGLGVGSRFNLQAFGLASLALAMLLGNAEVVAPLLR